MVALTGPIRPSPFVYGKRPSSVPAGVGRKKVKHIHSFYTHYKLKNVLALLKIVKCNADAARDGNAAFQGEQCAL